MEIDKELLDIFYEEVEELTEELESSLMELEEDNVNIELLSKIFRILHTIKGSCSLVGFNKISDFIHKLETIFQLIKEGKFSPEKQFINYFLTAVDYIRNLVENIDAVSQDDLISLLEKIYSLYGLELDIKEDSDKKINHKKEKVETLKENIKTEKFFKIKILPNEDFIIRGADIVEILNSFNKLGKAVWVLNNEKVPDFQQLNPEFIYFSWDIFLKTEKNLDAIKNLLIFLERNEFEIIEISENEFLNIFNQLKKPQHIEKIDKENKEESQKTLKKDFFQKEAFLKIPQHKLDTLLDLVGELVINQSILFSQLKKYNIYETIELAENIENIITELRNITLDIRMVQIGNFLNRFKRNVRDIAAEQGKKIDIIIEGGETELDKTIIDIIINPLTHILRNSIDHGIESPEERIKKNKPEKGIIKIKAEHVGGGIVISISDDGRGIDIDAVRKKAVDMGLISDDYSCSESEIINLIFHSGLSTSNIVSEISGRGVGMDAVKKDIKKIGGDISIFTEKDKGTEIKITLPLTLAIIEGLMVQVENEFYFIPNEFVKHCIEYFPNVKNEKEKGMFIVYRDKLIPFIRLKEYFKIVSTIKKIEEIVLVEFSGNMFGIAVDKIIAQKQIVIKNFGPILSKLPCFSGATIVEDGTMALILDVVALYNNIKAKYLTE